MKKKKPSLIMTDKLFRKCVFMAITPLTFTEFFGLKKNLFFLFLIIYFLACINSTYAEVRGKLLYFYSNTCAYCKAWENEIANIYLKQNSKTNLNLVSLIFF